MLRLTLTRAPTQERKDKIARGLGQSPNIKRKRKKTKRGDIIKRGPEYLLNNNISPQEILVPVEREIEISSGRRYISPKELAIYLILS